MHSSTESLNRFSPRPTRQLNKQRAQATVEFAVLAPLVFVCVGILVATTAMCLQYLSLHDVARTAARAASISEDSIEAARDAVGDSSVRVVVSENPVAGTVTVNVSKTGGVWWLNRLLGPHAISQSVTMMREAPIVLG